MCQKFKVVRQAYKENRRVTVQFPFGKVQGTVKRINEGLKSATIVDASGNEHLFMGDEGAKHVDVWFSPTPMDAVPA